MYSIIEKVIFLQDIDVFRQVRIEDLQALAAIAEEQKFHQNEVLYRVNEVADCMYLVIDGKVKVHRKGDEIIVGAKEAIGTWSLFDNQPRLATATAIEDTDTLRIARDDFYDLLSDNVRIAEGVFRSFARRLRALTDVLKTGETGLTQMSSQI